MSSGKAAKNLGRFFRGDFGHAYYSHIYAIAPRGGGNIKFGQALNIKSRFSSIQTGSPVKLEISASLFLPSDTEFAIHGHLESCRSHGEWFYPTPSANRIVELMKMGDGKEILFIIGLCRYLPVEFVNRRNYERGMETPVTRASMQMPTHQDLFKGYKREAPTVAR